MPSTVARETRGRKASPRTRSPHEHPWYDRVLKLTIPGPLSPHVDLWTRTLMLDKRISTVYHYRREIIHLARAFPDKAAGDFGRVDLLSYVAEAGEGKAPSTIKKTIAAIKQFFLFLAEMEVIDKDPARFLKSPAQRPVEPRYLSEADVSKLFAHALRDGLGMTVFMGLAYFAAMRAGSINALQWEDVDLEEGILTVRNAKGGKYYQVPIHPELDKLLRAWSEASRENDSGYVHAHIWRGEWKGYYYTGPLKRFKTIVEKACLPPDTAPHDLRRSSATHMHSAGKQISVISSVLGHASITTTARHYAFTTTTQTRDAVSTLGLHPF